MINHRIRIKESGSMRRARTRERDRRKTGEERRTWNQNAVVAQIKSSDVEAVERTVRYAKREAREKTKKMEKKFYEGLTGGLGRLTMYTRRYPRSRRIRTHGPSVQRCTTSDVPTLVFHRVGGSGAALGTKSLWISLAISVPPSRANFFFPLVPLGS